MSICVVNPLPDKALEPLLSVNGSEAVHWLQHGCHMRLDDFINHNPQLARVQFVVPVLDRSV